MFLVASLFSPPTKVTAESSVKNFPWLVKGCE